MIIASNSLTAPRKPSRRRLLQLSHTLTTTGHLLLVQERRALALSLQPLETMRRLLFLRLGQLSGLCQTMSRHLVLLSRQLSPSGLSQAVSQRLSLLSRQLSLSGLSQATPQRLVLLSRLLSGLSQAMSRHLHVRQLSELSQTFCNVFLSGFKTTSSCHKRQLLELNQTISRRLFLLGRQLLGLIQAVSQRLVLLSRSLSGPNQTLSCHLHLRQLLELNQTISCHLHIRPLHSLVRHQSFPTRRHRLTSQIRGRLRKKLAMDRGSTPLGA
jgi:hypothetical protein